MVADDLLDVLRKTCGEEHARPGAEHDAVGGVPAALVAAPASTEETAEVMRAAAAHGARIVARGAGTKLGWGAPPRGVDLVVDTARMSGVVEHASGDLVVVVSAGTPVETLAETVGRTDQMLALDQPLAGATVGGMVSVSTSGPYRLRYGTVRELLIGVTVVRADGTVARSGGKVVKNVAGYDLGKLYTGAYGTLGIVTEAAFRLHPRPPARAVVRTTIDGGSGADGAYGDTEESAWQRVRALLHSSLEPAAIEVDRPEAAGPVTVHALVEGVPSGVQARAADAAALLGDAEVDDEVPSWWGHYPWAEDDVALRFTTRISGLAAALRALRQVATRTGVPVRVRGSAGSGALYAGVPASAGADRLATMLAELRAAAAALDGTVVVLRATAELAGSLDLWGPVRGLDLMRRVKYQFDPDDRLAPGRFVGGI